MGLAGYLKIDDIEGESLRAEHEGEIDVHGIHWKIGQASAAVRSSGRGSGRTKARARVRSLTCFKFVDASSPYLALACLQGKHFDEMTLAVERSSAETHLDYLVITMTNVTVSGFEMLNDGTDPDVEPITERVALSFEKVTYRYTVQADDHSSGGEHEVEFDIVSGV